MSCSLITREWQPKNNNPSHITSNSLNYKNKGKRLTSVHKNEYNSIQQMMMTDSDGSF